MTANDFYKKYKGKYVDTRGKTGSSVDWYGNNYYMGQCASLARLALVKIWGYPDRPYGNAKDFVNTVTGTRVSKSNMKDGDIVVWTKCGYYGHIGVAYKGKVLNQNPHKARLDNLSTYGSYVIIRPYNYKGGNTVAKNKPKYLLEYMTENGYVRRLNSYDWDKIILKTARGKYNHIFEIGYKQRQIYKYDSKKKKWVADTKWISKEGNKTRIPARIVKKY